MEFRTLDMSAYPRARHFGYFNSLTNPYVGVTVDVDVGALYKNARTGGAPFFLSVLWCVGNAANAVPELRQRIVGDGVIEFTRCMTSHTEAMDDGTYAYCALDTGMDFFEFIESGRMAKERVRRGGSIEESADEALGMFFVSCVPWLSYTALTQPVPSPADSNPRITWGKCFEREGKLLMPMTLLVNHALVDGRHIAAFYEKLNNFIEIAAAECIKEK